VHALETSASLVENLNKEQKTVKNEGVIVRGLV